MITEVCAKSGLKKTVCSFLLKKATFIIGTKVLVSGSLHSSNLHADEKTVEYFRIRRHLKRTDHIKPQTERT